MNSTSSNIRRLMIHHLLGNHSCHLMLRNRHRTYKYLLQNRNFKSAWQSNSNTIKLSNARGALNVLLFQALCFICRPLVEVQAEQIQPHAEDVLQSGRWLNRITKVSEGICIDQIQCACTAQCSRLSVHCLLLSYPSLKDIRDSYRSVEDDDFWYLICQIICSLLVTALVKWLVGPQHSSNFWSTRRYVLAQLKMSTPPCTFLLNFGHVTRSNEA